MREEWEGKGGEGKEKEKTNHNRSYTKLAVLQRRRVPLTPNMLARLE